MTQFAFKRVNIITGHYGSGKTNFSVNLAIDLHAAGKKVCLVDLDIVNPYFRAADMKADLEQKGIRVLAPVYANTNLDIPALPPEIFQVISGRSFTVVLDVGGDDAGAVALGQFAKSIIQENDYLHFHVLNARRVLAESPEQAAEILRDIENASHIQADALINNTNLSVETDPGIITSSVSYAREVSRLTGLPVAFTTVREDLAGKLSGEVDDLYPVKIFVRPPW